MIGVALASTMLLGIFAHGSIDFAYYATFTRLSGLLLGSAFAFSFAPYRIRGAPGRGARVALDAAGAFGLLRAARARSACCTSSASTASLPTSTPRQPRRLPRRLPARRPRDAARDRGRRAPRLRRRPRARLAAAALDRSALVQPLPLALPDLLRHPARPRHPPARHLVPLDPLRGLAGVRHPPRALVRARPSCRSATSRRRSARARSVATARSCASSVGERRQRLVRRGAVIGERARRSLALMLGTGLATAQPQATSIPGVERRGSATTAPSSIRTRCKRCSESDHDDDCARRRRTRVTGATARPTTTTTTLRRRRPRTCSASATR